MTILIGHLGRPPGSGDISRIENEFETAGHDTYSITSENGIKKMMVPTRSMIARFFLLSRSYNTSTRT